MEQSDDEKQRDQIRRWYAEARAAGVSEFDFYREMSTIYSLEDIEDALLEDAEPEGNDQE